jgi:hypothetical protein
MCHVSQKSFILWDEKSICVASSKIWPITPLRHRSLEGVGAKMVGLLQRDDGVSLLLVVGIISSVS